MKRCSLAIYRHIIRKYIKYSIKEQEYDKEKEYVNICLFLICSLFLQQKCYSEEGRIKYEAAISFFPHVSEDDFAVSYDAYFSKVVFEAPGRRSKKREQGLMESLQTEANSLAEEANGKIFWDKPLIEARRG